jgi:hypothetical protein
MVAPVHTRSVEEFEIEGACSGLDEPPQTGRIMRRAPGSGMFYLTLEIYVR